MACSVSYQKLLSDEEVVLCLPILLMLESILQTYYIQSIDSTSRICYVFSRTDRLLMLSPPGELRTRSPEKMYHKLFLQLEK